MQNPLYTQLFAEYDKVIFDLTDLLSRFDDSNINSVPFEDSWTAGQLAEHIIKSNKLIISGLSSAGVTTERNKNERVEELKSVFLNYTIKLQSPSIIVPDNIYYSKEAVMAELQQTTGEIKRLRLDADLGQLVQGLPMGDVTKLELLHFALYHSQRHLNQLFKIAAALEVSAVQTA